MDEELWAEVSYVERSPNRERVLRALVAAGRPMTPSELAEELDIVVKTASRAVRGLHDHDLVESLDPDAPRDRRYGASERGRAVHDALDDVRNRDDTAAGAALAEASATYAPDRPDDLQDAIAYVRRSPNRRAVLAHLATVDVPLTPSEVADDLDIAFNSASRALQELVDRGLAACRTPDAERYRRYAATDRGETVYEAFSR